MLADHLGSGDYAITRAVFVGLLVVAVVVAAVSIARANGWTRIAGLALSVTLLFVAARMHFRWEDVTDAADRMTGPAGGEFRLSELDDFVGGIFGRLVVGLAVFVVGLVAVVARGHRRVAGHGGG